MSASEKVEDFDAFAADYDAALNRGLRFTGEGKEYFARTRIDWTRRVLGDQFAEGWDCLDFGCGTGTAAPFLHEGLRVRSMLGVDTSEASCSIARHTYEALPARFETISHLECCPDKFDVAYCNGVFHHIPVSQRAEAAASVYRALKPGGWFALWENNPWNPVTRLLMALVPFDRDAIMLWPAETRRMLEHAGFVIARTDFHFIFPNALRFLRGLEPSLCKLPLGGQYLVLARKPA